MRYIHYTAWCAYQYAEDGETRVDADFGSRHYWQTELGDLAEQLDNIVKGRREKDPRFQGVEGAREKEKE
jgi:hypothetical protein